MHSIPSFIVIIIITLAERRPLLEIICLTSLFGAYWMRYIMCSPNVRHKDWFSAIRINCVPATLKRSWVHFVGVLPDYTASPGPWTPLEDFLASSAINSANLDVCGVAMRQPVYGSRDTTIRVMPLMTDA